MGRPVHCFPFGDEDRKMMEPLTRLHFIEKKF